MVWEPVIQTYMDVSLNNYRVAKATKCFSTLSIHEREKLTVSVQIWQLHFNFTLIWFLRREHRWWNQIATGVIHAIDHFAACLAMDLMRVLHLGSNVVIP